MGKRGEGWVALQLILAVLITLAPSDRRLEDVSGLRPLGYLLMALGSVLGLLSARTLGHNLTPFPKPVAEGELVQDGLYRFVRHPIYLSLLVAALGWTLWRQSALGLALTLLLFAFFDAKSRREEQWLAAQYPDYPAYQQRVKRLIPWIY